MILSILASSLTKRWNGNVMWGVIVLDDDESYNPKTRAYDLTISGKWRWTPSLYIAYPGDRFWGSKRQGGWITLWDIHRFSFYADGRDERPSMILEGLRRPSRGYGLTGSGTLVQGDRLGDDGKLDTDGDILPCRWRLDAGMPDLLARD